VLHNGTLHPLMKQCSKACYCNEAPLA